MVRIGDRMITHVIGNINMHKEEVELAGTYDISRQTQSGETFYEIEWYLEGVLDQVMDKSVLMVNSAVVMVRGTRQQDRVLVQMAITE